MEVRLSTSPHNARIVPKAEVGVRDSLEFDGTFCRDAYKCICSEYRFTGEFKYLPEETEKSQAEEKENGRKKIAGLRSPLPLSVGSDGWDIETP